MQLSYAVVAQQLNRRFEKKILVKNNENKIFTVAEEASFE